MARALSVSLISLRSFARAGVAVAAVAGAAVFAGCTGGSYVNQQKDTAVVQEGDTVHDKLDPAVVDAPEVEEYLAQVGRRIIDAARELDAEGLDRDGNHDPKTTAWMFADDVTFHLVNNPKINAVATGGRHMYIFNGFLQECQSEEELAAVMAHEFGHVYGRHVQKGQARKDLGDAGKQALRMLIQGGDTAATPEDQLKGDAAVGLVDFGGGLVAATPTREEEKQADDLGFAFYTRAGYDPEKFAALFQSQLDKGAKDVKTEYAMNWFDPNDHPGLYERVKATQDRVSRLPPDAPTWRKPPVASPVKLRKVKEAAAAAVAAMPQTADVVEAQNLLGAFPSCFSDHDDHD